MDLLDELGKLSGCAVLTMKRGNCQIRRQQDDGHPEILSVFSEQFGLAPDAVPQDLVSVGTSRVQVSGHPSLYHWMDFY